MGPYLSVHIFSMKLCLMMPTLTAKFEVTHLSPLSSELSGQAFTKEWWCWLGIKSGGHGRLKMSSAKWGRERSRPWRNMPRSSTSSWMTWLFRCVTCVICVSLGLGLFTVAMDSFRFGPLFREMTEPSSTQCSSLTCMQETSSMALSGTGEPLWVSVIICRCLHLVFVF